MDEQHQKPPALSGPLLAPGHTPLRGILHSDLDNHLSNRFSFHTHLFCVGPYLSSVGDPKSNQTGTLYSSCLLSSGEMKGVFISVG